MRLIWTYITCNFTIAKNTFNHGWRGFLSATFSSARCMIGVGRGTIKQIELTHCGLVTPYGDRGLAQHWLMYWLVALRHQAISEPAGHQMDTVRYLLCFVVISDRQILPISHKIHDDVIKWKHFPRYWPFVRGVHRLLVNSLHKGQWRGALMFSLVCAWINGWVNNGEASGLKRHPAHYDVTVRYFISAGTIVPAEQPRSLCVS